MMAERMGNTSTTRASDDSTLMAGFRGWFKAAGTRSPYGRRAQGVVWLGGARLGRWIPRRCCGWHPQPVRPRASTGATTTKRRSPSFVRQPEGNGCFERFTNTISEQVLWARMTRLLLDLLETGVGWQPCKL